MTFLYLSVAVFTLINVALVMLNVKLYTEIMKVRDITRRDK